MPGNRQVKHIQVEEEEAISQIDIKLYEYTPLFPIQYQLNMEYLRVASCAPYYLVYTLMIYQKLHGIALLNSM